MSHDQNFKNLILDYPRETIAFSLRRRGMAVDSGARILPVREEQLKERLGDRFRELDIPLLVEWPDGRRAAFLFVLEEETEPADFRSTAWRTIVSTLPNCSSPRVSSRL